MIRKFLNRTDAGKQLAARLEAYKKYPGILVLGLPRGGVVAAYEVAKALDAPLDILLVRKLGVPWQPELAMGALAEGGSILLDAETTTHLNLSENQIRRIIAQEEKELLRRQSLYRGHKTPPVVEGREVIVVDDGLATGATMRAAVNERL